VGGVVLLVLFALAARDHGAPLDAPADPSSDYPARPEWYFLALFELLKHFHGPLEPVGAVGVPLLAAGLLVALPLIDKQPSATLRQRARYLLPVAGLAAGAALLTVASLRADAADAEFARARAAASRKAARAIELARAGIPPEGPLAMLRADPETRGPELFAAKCASCHRLGDLGPPAGKHTAPDLTGFGTGKWIHAVLEDPDADDKFGRTPFKGMMPSMTRPPADPEAAKLFVPLSAGDREAITAFLEAQARGERAEGTPGETLVRRRCTSCHRLDGKTDDEESLAPELRGWASRAWIEAQIENPGSGKTFPPGVMAASFEGRMPAFEHDLPPAERALLAEWLWKRAREN
jgi:ubiquinol-cytochrome c reductase cytochrome b subunit